MFPDRVSSPGPLTYESGALSIALRGLAYAHVQCISELCCKFEIPASKTVGGVGETRILLQSVTDGRTYRQGKNYMPLPISGRGHKKMHWLTMYNMFNRSKSATDAGVAETVQ